LYYLHEAEEELWDVFFVAMKDLELVYFINPLL